MHRTLSRARGAATGALLFSLALVPAVPASAAPTQVKPGFNLFSAQQDVEVGRQSAQQAERQLPLLNNRNVDSYVDSVFRRLVAQAPGTKFPYQVRVVNAKDINAFALPGGYVYLNRGTLQAAQTEGQLAGVLAHEISHVALRHGTHNASKAYVTQAGLGVLGGILGRGQSGTTQQIINVVGGLGLNAVFLKYSRDAETEADVVGSQIMARAGYDPMEMASFFEILRRQQGKDPGAVSQFMSDHPAPANREARIRQEVQAMGATNVRRASASGDLSRIQAELRGMGNAPSMADISRGAARGNTRGNPRSSDDGRYPDDSRYPSDNRYPNDSRYPNDNRYPNDRTYPSDDRNDPGSYPDDRTYPQSRRNNRVGSVRVEAPSTRFVDFRQRDDFFEMQIPSNWRAYEADNGFGVTIVPEGGAVDQGNGEQSIVYGVIVNHYDPFEGGYNAGRRGRSGNLDQATSDLVNQIRQTNTYLRSASRGRRETIDGAPALSTVLSGTSPVTGEEERVTVYTRQMDDGHVVYALLIAPGRDYGVMGPAFSRMLQSFRVNDQVAHR